MLNILGSQMPRFHRSSDAFGQANAGTLIIRPPNNLFVAMQAEAKWILWCDVGSGNGHSRLRHRRGFGLVLLDEVLSRVVPLAHEGVVDDIELRVGLASPALCAHTELVRPPPRTRRCPSDHLG